MSWATNYIKQLQEGQTIKFRPRGESMAGKIESGQLVTVVPASSGVIEIDDIVLCKINGHCYLHIVKAVRSKEEQLQFQICNNKGFTNGWTSRKNIYGKVTKIEK